MPFKTLKGEPLVNLNITTKNLTGFAKWLAGAFGAFAVAWATPSTHDALVGIITKYPHGAEVIGILGSLVAIWGVLHNPVKQEAK
jgi:hypothetical protein